MERSLKTYFAVKQIYRKHLVIPAEHGSWSWLLVPYLTGGLVARIWSPAVVLVLVGGLASFLIRQPASAWMRARAGRGRRADGRLAAGWTLAFGLVSVLCLAGLLLLERWALLWLLLPIALLFVLYLLAARQRRAAVRSLWMELAGAIGLAAMAPAAYIAAMGGLDQIAWALWVLMAAQNVLGVLYVRLRIADTHGREMSRAPIFYTHALVLAILAIAALFEAMPPLVTLPFVGFLLRATWATGRERPIANIKRFGFSEIGIEILGGAFVVAAYWLA